MVYNIFRPRWIVLSLALLAMLISLKWAWVSPDAWKKPGCALTQNAAWISVDWTSQPVDTIALQELAQTAKTRKFSYLYPYTSYLKADGSFNPSYTYAKDFVSQFRVYNEQTYLLAWIGIPLQNNREIGIQGWVDLSKKDQRQKIVDFVVYLLQEADFDGIHLNVETVANYDLGYLRLLGEVRDAIGSEYILSVASIYWLPTSINSLPGIDGYRWSDEYYQAIAKHVNQISTMTYDSLMPYPALYRLWMREQVQGISTSLADEDVELLIGLSVSEEQTVTHNPQAESLLNALAGICAGIENDLAQHKINGLGIYAAWEATQTDWQNWEAWLVIP